MPGPYKIVHNNTNTYVYSDYGNKFFANMFLSFRQNYGENSIVFEFSDNINSEVKTIQNTEFINSDIVEN